MLFFFVFDNCFPKVVSEFLENTDAAFWAFGNY